MGKNENSQHKEEIQDRMRPEHSNRRSWKRIHRTWVFWIFLVLMFVAILYYIISVDFAFAPR